MGQLFEEIDESLRRWIEAQPMWFVASAPLAADGHVNMSPRGHDSFSILGPRRVGWVDYTGSGVETIAHLRENGRIVVMFCAFQGPPRILRLHGRGEVVLPGEPRFAELLGLGFQEPEAPEARRAIIVVHVQRVADSCGYGVPLMEVTGARRHYELSVAKRLRTQGVDGYAEHRRRSNASSIDGMPALDPDWVSPAQLPSR